MAQHALTSANVGLKKRDEQIVEQSPTDAITGVGNRRKLEQALPIEIGRSRRDGTALIALLTDVDQKAVGTGSSRSPADPTRLKRLRDADDRRD